MTITNANLLSSSKQGRAVETSFFPHLNFQNKLPAAPTLATSPYHLTLDLQSGRLLFPHLQLLFPTPGV